MQENNRTRRFAAGYDAMLERAERAFLADLREQLLGGLTGRVVEIGAGTGANLAHYRRATHVDLVEPLPSMATQLRARIDAGRPNPSASTDPAAPPAPPAPTAALIAGEAESLPLPDACADAVVCTLVLCSVRDVDAALAQVRRVLAPGGVFVFIEHGRGRGMRRLVQGALTPLSRRYAANCHLDRDIRAHLVAAGFARIEEVAVPAPPAIRLLPEWPFLAGRAR